MEYLSQYEHSITYIKGEDNTMADALSRLPIDETPEPLPITATFTIENDPKLFNKIHKGYSHDTWCTGILDDLNRGVIDSKLSGMDYYSWAHGWSYQNTWTYENNSSALRMTTSVILAGRKCMHRYETNITG